MSPSCHPMDTEQLQRTLDVLVGQIGNLTQQVRADQADAAEFCRLTMEHLDNLDRARSMPFIYTPSRPPFLIGDDLGHNEGHQRAHYPPQQPRQDRDLPHGLKNVYDHKAHHAHEGHPHGPHRAHQARQNREYHMRDPAAPLLKNIKIDVPTFDGSLDPQRSVKLDLRR
ncbi:hypothetical protein KFK09_005008 [Dendrobium nobile]|uniref:Uncharacterized protein n=1 Tax=Dendrobium nobile TaxID=94219 RepID=A0A8T3BZE5_DENNO|nr:hypothetical protein KFK09_005008 [Dendrobium nobile]